MVDHDAGNLRDENQGGAWPIRRTCANRRPVCLGEREDIRLLVVEKRLRIQWWLRSPILRARNAAHAFLLSQFCF